MYITDPVECLLLCGSGLDARVTAKVGITGSRSREGRNGRRLTRCSETIVLPGIPSEEIESERADRGLGKRVLCTGRRMRCGEVQCSAVQCCGYGVGQEEEDVENIIPTECRLYGTFRWCHLGFHGQPLPKRRFKVYTSTKPWNILHIIPICCPIHAYLHALLYLHGTSCRFHHWRYWCL